jgi:tyrosine-specific transport protein
VKNRALTIGIVFAPPLAIALAYPDIFLNALDFVGGIGVVILFGIFPCIIALKRKGPLFKRLVFAVPVLILFVSILFFKAQQELGMSRLKPTVEYWTNFRFFSHR